MRVDHEHERFTLRRCRTSGSGGQGESLTISPRVLPGAAGGWRAAEVNEPSGRWRSPISAATAQRLGRLAPSKPQASGHLLCCFSSWRCPADRRARFAANKLDSL
jgi:hypothetical protein